VTDPDYRHYLLIVDRSGSMDMIRAEAQAGIRHYAWEQAALPGRATMTLVQFDIVPETVHDFAPLEAVATYELVPRGATALLDACGHAITDTGARLAGLPEEERPGKVLVLITTDGQENHSREYTRSQVQDLVTRQQRDYGWQFSYAGANVDAFAEAASIGIPRDAALHYKSEGRSTVDSFRKMSAASSRYVVGQSAGVAYTDEEREEVDGDGTDEQSPLEGLPAVQAPQERRPRRR
jgi:hypothetical protein